MLFSTNGVLRYMALFTASVTWVASGLACNKRSLHLHECNLATAFTLFVKCSSNLFRQGGEEELHYRGNRASPSTFTPRVAKFSYVLRGKGGGGRPKVWVVTCLCPLGHSLVASMAKKEVAQAPAAGMESPVRSLVESMARHGRIIFPAFQSTHANSNLRRHETHTQDAAATRARSRQVNIRKKKQANRNTV